MASKEILPALIGQPLLRGTLIFDKAIRDRDRRGRRSHCQRRLDRGPQFDERLFIGGALHIQAGQQDEQRRRIDAARNIARTAPRAAPPSRRPPRISCRIFPGSASANGSVALAWKKASRRSTPWAMRGSTPQHMQGGDQSVAARNVVEYQGMPGIGVSCPAASPSSAC